MSGDAKRKTTVSPSRAASGQAPVPCPQSAVHSQKSTTRSGYSGFGELSGGISEKGHAFGKILVRFFSAWESVIGSEDFYNEKLWMQATMLSSLLFTFPDIRRQAGRREIDSWLRSRKAYWKSWKPHPDAYLGMKGARRLGKAACRRLGFSSAYL